MSDKGNAGDLESPTEFIDYLAMRRYAINYNDSDSNYYGLNLPGNKVSKIHRNERVYLAIPNQIQTQYQPNYRQVDIGVAGIAAAGLMNSGGNMDQIVETIEGAAAAALPEFASAAIASSASNINQMLGLAGNIDANSGNVIDQKGEIRIVPINTKTASYTLQVSDHGKFINTDSQVTIPPSVFSAGQTVTIYNDSGSNITLTKGSGVTMYWSQNGTNANRTLATRGIATILCVGSNEFVITGGTLS